MQKTIDVMEEFHGAMIQHGPCSERIYLIKIGKAQPRFLIDALRKLAEENNYGKIFAKVPVSLSPFFLSAGYVQEAMIPEFYKGGESASFLGLFLDPERARDRTVEVEEAVLERAKKKAGPNSPVKTLPEHLLLRRCIPEDAVPMAKLYAEVFPTYPFPINCPDYITKTMSENITYLCAENEAGLAALSSAEKDGDGANAEMTDFATLPTWRGHGLAGHLLARMEELMAKQGVITAYTIARAVSTGMNCVFSRAGYSYAGRLVNNTMISGSIESMNVWYKRLL